MGSVILDLILLELAEICGASQQDSSRLGLRVLASWSSTHPIPWEMGQTFLSGLLTQNGKRRNRDSVSFQKLNQKPWIGVGGGVHRNYLNSGIITSGENEPIIFCLFIKFAYYDSIGWNEMSQEAGMQMGRGPAWPRECPQVAPISSQGRAKTNSSEVPSPHLHAHSCIKFYLGD